MSKAMIIWTLFGYIFIKEARGYFLAGWEEREFQMTRQKFDLLMENLKDKYLPELPKVRVSGNVCIVKVPGDFIYMDLIEGLQTK